MKYTGKPVLVLCTTLLIGGCGPQYTWVKPSAPDASSQRDLTSCEASALKDLPPSNVIDSSYSDRSGKWKDKDKKGRYDENDDTSYSYSDANEDKRDILIQDCMFRAGWEQKPLN